VLGVTVAMFSSHGAPLSGKKMRLSVFVLRPSIFIV